MTNFAFGCGDDSQPPSVPSKQGFEIEEVIAKVKELDSATQSFRTDLRNRTIRQCGDLDQQIDRLIKDLPFEKWQIEVKRVEEKWQKCTEPLKAEYDNYWQTRPLVVVYQGGRTKCGSPQLPDGHFVPPDQYVAIDLPGHPLWQFGEFVRNGFPSSYPRISPAPEHIVLDYAPAHYLMEHQIVGDDLLDQIRSALGMFKRAPKMPSSAPTQGRSTGTRPRLQQGVDTPQTSEPVT